MGSAPMSEHPRAGPNVGVPATKGKLLYVPIYTYLYTIALKGKLGQVEGLDDLPVFFFFPSFRRKGAGMDAQCRHTSLGWNPLGP